MAETYSSVPELNLLKEFEGPGLSQQPGWWYARDFYLMDYGDPEPLEAWVDHRPVPEFTNRVIPFAGANASGSAYAIWRIDDREDLATLPVVALGDEGELEVVTRNLRELLQVIGYDTALSFYLDVPYFMRHEELDEIEAHYEPSPRHEAYVAWLAQTFELAPVDDPEPVVAAARAEFSQRFTEWVYPLVGH